ncbi:MAG: hypothetical protein IT215_00555 [Chitinophagaceae bacterium]|nr:hypothetical protein [Chitinophagaceae bacterium]
MQILKSIWFNSLQDGSIGIVKTKDMITNEEKYYIGNATGYNEKSDEANIARWGAKLNPDSLKDFFK